MSDLNRRVLPGFGLSLGYASTYMGLLVMIPIIAVLLKSSTLGWEQFVAAVWTPRARAAYGLTLGASLIAAVVLRCQPRTCAEGVPFGEPLWPLCPDGKSRLTRPRSE